MTKEEIIIIISLKLQKQMHMILSKKQQDSPKMLCDNLASRVLTSLLESNVIKDLEEDEE